MIGRFREERGVALITAILVSFVVVLLGTVVVSLAIHNSTQSSFDRKRVQGVAAAEAGLNYYFSHLQSVGPADIQCSVTGSLTATPTGEFTVTPTFFDVGGNPLPCPLPPGVVPTSVLLRSVGRSSAATPTRTMEAYLNLIQIQGGPFGPGAIFSDLSVRFDSNVQVTGNGSNNADVYTNQDVFLLSNSTIYGTLYAPQGAVALDSNAEVKQDVWASREVTMDSNAIVRGNVISSNSFIRLDSNSHIFGNAKAAGTITVGTNARIDGLQIPNTPSAPPPVRAFPTFTFNAAAWEADGYTVQTFSDCNAAKSFIEGITGGDWVVRITPACHLEWNSNERVTVRGNLAIISDGSLRLDSNSCFTTGTRCNNSGPGPWTLHLIVGLSRVFPCDFEMDSNTNIGAGLKVLIYSPCRVHLNSNSLVVNGQIFGGEVDFDSNTTLNYEPIDVAGSTTGPFEEDIVYIREVRNS